MISAGWSSGVGGGIGGSMGGGTQTTMHGLPSGGDNKQRQGKDSRRGCKNKRVEPE